MKQTQIKQGGGGNNSLEAQKLGSSVLPSCQATEPQSCKKGFTLAEVLITLVIIGVVAALTIPTVITNYQKNQYVTQLKKNYNYLSNGFRTMMAREGVTKLSDTDLLVKISNGGLSTYEDKANELKKTFNIIKVYDGDASKLPVEDNQIIYKRLNGSPDEVDGLLTTGIVLADGSIVDFWLHGLQTAWCPGVYVCHSLEEFQKLRNTQTKLWQWVGRVSIDVNGIKGPNQFGRDYFQFYIGNDGVLYPRGSLDVAVGPWESNSSTVPWKYEYDISGDSCLTTDTYGGGCAARIMAEGWKMNY